MIKVLVKKESKFPVKTAFVREVIKKYLTEKGIVSDSLVNTSFVSEKTMYDLSEKYLGEQETLHNILTFSESDFKGKFIVPYKNINYLGEIVVCYPIVVEDAKKENVLVNDKIQRLLEHGCLHLLGIHHD